MFKRFYRALITLLGLLCGAGVSFLSLSLLQRIEGFEKFQLPVSIGLSAVVIISFGIIFYFVAPYIQRSLEGMTRELDSSLQKIPLREFVWGTIGLLLGIIFAFLISQLWASMNIPFLGMALSILVYVILGYMGMHVASRKSGELTSAFRGMVASKGSGIARGGSKKANRDLSPKILDTSVIIDGRIADIMKTGFIEGQIVIPEFVLNELRHIADSSDSLKRNRGRRGLDILNRIQSQYGVEIYNTESDKTLQAIPEVDVKLLELAAIMNGKVVTNDYNLNKVATIKGVPVLNINELANMLKPVVLPGEIMEVIPVKEGKESEQSLAYLDDGTMIVVEDGHDCIGQEISVTVTSVLQTSAGRMIFARVRGRN
ncbi:MAG: PIN/TRAM domain-containing protein [Anaerovoracaceae bacterium]